MFLLKSLTTSFFNDKMFEKLKSSEFESAVIWLKCHGCNCGSVGLLLYQIAGAGVQVFRRPGVATVWLPCWPKSNYCRLSCELSPAVCIKYYCHPFNPLLLQGIF